MNPFVPVFELGSHVDVVALLVCWDDVECNHLVMCMASKKMFKIEGAIPKAHTLTLFDVLVIEDVRIPKVQVTADSRVLPHVECAWEDLTKVVSVCSGLGALDHGAHAVGFTVVASVDCNKHMVRMHDTAHGGKSILGDICSKDTLVELWTQYSRPCTLVGGVACQPYSRLGDQLEGDDARAQSLPGTLRCAYYLQYPLVIIECVPQARDSPWVNMQVKAFCDATGFRRSDQILELQSCLPCRRSRWWMILSSPVLGEIAVRPIPEEFAIHRIAQIMPEIISWSAADEEELRLNPAEKVAFGAQESGGPHLLNMNSVLPCPLHSWGSQLRACPCECRSQGLSSERLASKGLHGVIIRSADGEMRHIHPAEVSALAGVDPNLSHDDNPRLVLSGMGQLASPIHSLWIFATVLHRVEFLRFGHSEVSPTKELLAYLGWFLMRCKLLWSKPQSVHSELEQRCEAWKAFQLFPQKSLQHLQIWDAALPRSFASMLSQIQQAPVDSEIDRFVKRELLSMAVEPVESASISPTVPFVADEDPFLVVLSVVLPNHAVESIQVRAVPGATVGDIVDAEIKLQSVQPEQITLVRGVEMIQELRPMMELTLVVSDLAVNIPQQGPSEVAPARSDVISSESPENAPAPLVETPVLTTSLVMTPSPAAPVQSPLVTLTAEALLSLSGPAPTHEAELQPLYGQAITVQDRQTILQTQGQVMANDEISWHLKQILHEHTLRRQKACPQEHPWCHDKVAVVDPMLVRGWLLHGPDKIAEWCQSHGSLPTCVVMIIPLAQHWVPFVLYGHNGVLQACSWDVPTSDHDVLAPVLQAFAHALGFQEYQCFRMHRLFMSYRCCGALALCFIQHHLICSQLPDIDAQALTCHADLRQRFSLVLSRFRTCVRPWVWCAGAQDEAVHGLIPLLIEQGVHTPEAEARAIAAVQAIGATQVLQALSLRHPWKQLKTLGNMAKFQFLLQSELEAKISKGAGKRVKGKKSKMTDEVRDFQLDPHKLTVAAGCFEFGGVSLNQLSLAQLGPLAEGIVLVDAVTAEPYVRAAQVISKGPLALIVISGDALSHRCALPHSSVTVPCRCSLNQEPLLVDALMVQIGTGHVQKTVDSGLVKVAALDVCTLKILIYKDEVTNWDDVVSAPIKYVTQVIPLFSICEGTGCSCPKWHPPMDFDGKTVLQDVWRRQYLRPGFKPAPAKEAQIFSACLRVPVGVLPSLLASSGSGGVYFEPRSADARTVDQEYTVVWVPKTTKRDLLRMRHTLSMSTGLARMGDRLGLRCEASVAKDLHAAIRPDSIFLASGDRTQYSVGPMPYGSDRTSVTRAFAAVGWDVKPLQPFTSVAGKGSMWMVMAICDPPQNLLRFEHGDVVVNKHKVDKTDKQDKPRPVSSTATLQLCHAEQASSDPKAPKVSSGSSVDPWQHGLDPWQHMGTKQDPTAALQAFENKLEQSVLAKIPPVVSSQAERLTTLENQVQQLIGSHQQLEQHVKDHEAHQSSQLSQMQGQINHQGQQIQGAIHSHEQNIQAMFENQMQQIRTILSKRTRDGEVDSHME
eukprot:Skav236759  [mRNA]  locus=scaffold3662:65575:70209:+ [translate_table: standard]